MVPQLFPQKESASWLECHCLSGCADYTTRYQIFQFQVRSTADGDDFTGQSILLAGAPAYLLDVFCRTGR